MVSNKISNKNSNKNSNSSRTKNRHYSLEGQVFQVIFDSGFFYTKNNINATMNLNRDIFKATVHKLARRRTEWEIEPRFLSLRVFEGFCVITLRKMVPSS
jgi:hypothetical protein